MSKQPSIEEMAKKYWLSLRWGDVKERTLDGVVKDAFLAGAAAQRKLDEERIAWFIACVENVDKAWWFQPSPESGVCSLCDGGQDPNYLTEHEPWCSIDRLHNALIGFKQLSQYRSRDDGKE